MKNYLCPVFAFDIGFKTELSVISGIENESLIPLSDEFYRDLCRCLRYLADHEKALSDWFASLYSNLAKTLAEKSDLIMKAYMIGGTLLSALSLISTLVSSPLTLVTQSLLAGAMSGIGWNLVDSVGGIFATPKLFKEAQESVLDYRFKTALAWTNAIYCSTVLPGLSAWGFATLIQSVKAIGLKAVVMSGVGLGAAVALASSAFAFAGGMFVVAAISGFDWYRAAQKSEPVVLLRDRLKQYDALQAKIKTCSDEQEKQKLTQKLTRITRQAEAMAYYCNTHNDTLNVPLTDNDKNHVVFKAAITQSAKLTHDEQSKQEKLASYLIKKQQDKAKEKRFETIANVVGGAGALLGGLALLVGIPHVTIPLLVIGSVLFLAISSGMKAYQLYDKYRVHKEKQKALLAEKKDDAALVRDYFNGNEVDGLSEYDTKRIATMQCKARLFSAKTNQAQVAASAHPDIQTPWIQ